MSMLCSLKGSGLRGSYCSKAGDTSKETGTAYLLKGRSEREGQVSRLLSGTRKTEYRLPNNPKEYQLFVYKKVS